METSHTTATRALHRIALQRLLSMVAALLLAFSGALAGGPLLFEPGQPALSGTLQITPAALAEHGQTKQTAQANGQHQAGLTRGTDGPVALLPDDHVRLEEWTPPALRIGRTNHLARLETRAYRSRAPPLSV